MNILFVHEVDWLNKVVFDIHSLAESLSVSGNQVYVIDYESLWTRNGPFDFGTMKTREVDNAARANPDAVIHLRRPGFIKIPGLSRLSAGFTHYLEIRKTIHEKGINAIVLYGVATNGLQTTSLARKFNLPVVFRAIDIPHQLVPYPILRPIVRWLEKQVYSRADLLLPHTPKEVNYLITMGAKEAKVKLLALPVEISLFRPFPGSTELRRKWGLGERDHIILFQGTLYNFSGLGLFLSQFPTLLEQMPGIKLLLVGDGPQRPLLERMATQLGLQEHIVITGFQPYQTVPDYINLATICINPFLINDVTREIFPGKIPQYLACGKPVISTSLPGLMSVIAGEEQGIIYVNSIEEMIKEAVSLLKSTERRQKLGDAGVNYVKQVHSCEKIARQLHTILEGTIKEKQNGTVSKRM